MYFVCKIHHITAFLHSSTVPGYRLKQGITNKKHKNAKNVAPRTGPLFTVSELKGEAENCLILPQPGMCVEQSKFCVTLQMSMNDYRKP